jgi:phage I-like protein
MTTLIRTSFELESSGDMIHILPAAGTTTTRDKRTFKITSLAQVIAASETPMLVDWEHQSESWTGSTKAAGWIEALEASPTGVWGRVTWTPDGQRDVSSRAYRFLSPVIELDSDTRVALKLISVALTNKPALSALSEIGSEIGSAYRERVRVACSTRETGSDLTTKDLSRLAAHGVSAAEAYAAEQYNRERRAAVHAEPLDPDSDAAVRARFSGTAAEYLAATRFQAERAARFRGV